MKVRVYKFKSKIGFLKAANVPLSRPPIFIIIQAALFACKKLKNFIPALL
jgi:hypothetical protein